jgi:hypothetical protein
LIITIEGFFRICFFRKEKFEMNDQNQTPASDQNTPPPTYRDWREQRREERIARHEARWHRHAGRPFGWIGGAILILLGVIFLAQNMGVPLPANLWALFILIPAFWSFVAAWNIYRESSSITRAVSISLAAGVLLTILALIFLFNLAFGLFWPVLLIVGGLIILLTAFLPR